MWVVAEDRTTARLVLDSAEPVGEVDANGCATRLEMAAPTTNDRISVCRYDGDGVARAERAAARPTERGPQRRSSAAPRTTGAGATRARAGAGVIARWRMAARPPCGGSTARAVVPSTTRATGLATESPLPGTVARVAGRPTPTSYHRPDRCELVGPDMLARMSYEAAENRRRRGHGVPLHRAQRAEAARAVARPVAELRDDRPEETQRAILRRAFDRGVTHFDLANNYGPPYGRAEENFGRYLADDFKPYRDELVISTKAGYDMWPGPYGQGGGSRKYVLASLDQSLARMGLDYVDIFYSHRFDPETPVEETMMALDTAVRSGRALYAGISSYSADKTREAATIARELGTPLLIHQPSYSMLNRWIEGDLLDELEDQGMGCIVFTALAQGLLTDRYLDGVPADSRAARDDSTIAGLDEGVLGRVRALNEIAEREARSSPSSPCSGRCATTA